MSLYITREQRDQAAVFIVSYRGKVQRTVLWKIIENLCVSKCVFFFFFFWSGYRFQLGVARSEQRIPHRIQITILF